jgi:uncharacterized protein YlxW (UPF0749 family)
VQALWRIAVPVAFGAAGVLFATSAGVAQGQDLRGTRTDLGDLIRAEQQRADALTGRVHRLRQQVDAATNRAGVADRRVAVAQSRTRSLEIAAGTIAVTGPSMTVTLNDAPRSRQLPPGASPDDVVVHQQDVQGVVNALWSGGAEAMQIMDQRVIATSAVRCVGNTLILQGRVYSPPYVITALGDPTRLGEALDASSAVSVYRYYADTYGLGWATSTSATTRLPAYGGSLNLLHAQAGT